MVTLSNTREHATYSQARTLIQSDKITEEDKQLLQKYITFCVTRLRHSARIQSERRQKSRKKSRSKSQGPKTIAPPSPLTSEFWLKMLNLSIHYKDSLLISRCLDALDDETLKTWVNKNEKPHEENRTTPLLMRYIIDQTPYDNQATHFQRLGDIYLTLLPENPSSYYAEVKPRWEEQRQASLETLISNARYQHIAQYDKIVIRQDNMHNTFAALLMHLHDKKRKARWAWPRKKYHQMLQALHQEQREISQGKSIKESCDALKKKPSFRYAWHPIHLGTPNTRLFSELDNIAKTSLSKAESNISDLFTPLFDIFEKLQTNAILSKTEKKYNAAGDEILAAQIRVHEGCSLQKECAALMCNPKIRYRSGFFSGFIKIKNKKALRLLRKMSMYKITEEEKNLTRTNSEDYMHLNTTESADQNRLYKKLQANFRLAQATKNYAPTQNALRQATTGCTLSLLNKLIGTTTTKKLETKTQTLFDGIDCVDCPQKVSNMVSNLAGYNKQKQQRNPLNKHRWFSWFRPKTDEARSSKMLREDHREYLHSIPRNSPA
jgi:hypothetical protein